MFQDLNPQDQTTAFLEIGIMLLGAAIIGFVTAWLIRRAGKSAGADKAVEERHLADLKKNHAAVQGLKGKLEKAKNEYAALEKKYKDTEQALKEKSKPAVVFTTELEDVKKRLQKEKAASESLQKEINRLKSEAKSADPVAIGSDSDPRVDQLQKEVAALTAQNKELIRTAESVQAEQEDSGVIDRLQKELTALKSQNEQLLKKGNASAPNDETKAQVTELERQLRQQKIEVVQKTADIASLQNKLTAMEATVAAADQPEEDEKLAKLEVELESRAAIITRMEGQIAKSESIAREAANTAAEIPQLKEKIKNLEVENLSLKSKPVESPDTKALAKANAEIKKLEAENLSLKSKQAESPDTKALVKANAEIKKLKTALTEAKAKTKNAAPKVTATPPSSGESSSELEWLRKEKEDQEEEITELEDTILSLEKDNAQLRSRLRDKTGAQTEKHLQQVENERNALRQELEQLRKESQSTDLHDFSHLGLVASGESNSLSDITGIAPEHESKLNAVGIFTYRQLSKMNSTDLEKIEELLGLEAGRVKSEKWVKQAKKLLKSN